MRVPAFGPLVTNLIDKPNTPPEIKYYAFKAAEGLLAAHDILKLTTPSVRDHTLRPPELAALAVALESNIFDSKRVLTFPAARTRSSRRRTSAPWWRSSAARPSARSPRSGSPR